MHYQVSFTEAGIQLIVALLQEQPVKVAGALFEDVRGQVQAQEAAALAAERKAIEDAALARHAKVKPK